MDPDIFEIFYSAIIKNQLPIVPLKDTELPVTLYRSIHYTRHLDGFFRLLELITESKDAHEQYYTAKDDIDTKKRMVLIINELQRKIRKLADIIKILLVTRHGETLSDLTY